MKFQSSGLILRYLWQFKVEIWTSLFLFSFLVRTLLTETFFLDLRTDKLCIGWATHRSRGDLWALQLCSGSGCHLIDVPYKQGENIWAVWHTNWDPLLHPDREWLHRRLLGTFWLAPWCHRCLPQAVPSSQGSFRNNTGCYGSLRYLLGGSGRM